MAFISPFKGFRYNTEKAGQLEDLISPPFDIINKNAEEALRSRHPCNIIRLDLANIPGQDKNVHPDRFTDAAALLDLWIKEGILTQDQEPALYPYDVEYEIANGTKRIRKGFVCLIALTEFEKNTVKPHEHTFDSVIKDRLELTRQCRAQFSQVFSTFSDPDNRALALLEKVKNEPVANIIDDDGCRHVLWKVTDLDVIEAISNHLSEASLYIADGHHQYTTALTFRNEVVRQSGDTSSVSPENFITMCLCPMEDEGLSILPVHRLLRYPGKLELQGLLYQLDTLFFIEEITGGSRETLLSELLSVMGDQEEESIVGEPPALGFYHPGEDRCFVLTRKKEGLARLKEYHPSLRDIGAAIVTSLIIEDVLHLDNEQCEQDHLLTFHSDISEALDISVKENSVENELTPLLFLVNPTTIGQVKSVSDAGLFMPHKSTYFYPKIVTGLVMNVLGEAGTVTDSAK